LVERKRPGVVALHRVDTRERLEAVGELGVGGPALALADRDPALEQGLGLVVALLLDLEVREHAQRLREARGGLAEALRLGELIEPDQLGVLVAPIEVCALAVLHLARGGRRARGREQERREREAQERRRERTGAIAADHDPPRAEPACRRPASSVDRGSALRPRVAPRWS